MAAAAMLGGATSALGSGNAWGNSTNTTYRNRTADDELYIAPPVKKLRQFNPNGFLSPNTQTAIDRRAALDADKTDMRETRARNLANTLKNAKGDRLTALGNVISENNTRSPLQGFAQTGGKLFNDVMSGGAQLGHNIWNGVNAFISPGAYAVETTPLPKSAQQNPPQKTMESWVRMDVDLSLEESDTLFNGYHGFHPTYFPYQSPLGEQAKGKNTQNQPKPITFQNDQSLSDQLWHNYKHGQGQPIELNMADLDFNDNINMQKYFENTGAMPLLKRDIVNQRALSQRLKKKVKVANGEKVTHIWLEDDITKMGLHFEPGTPEWAAFGQLNVDLSNVHIVVHHDRQNLIEVNANIKPTEKDGELDNFDFNPFAGRNLLAELAVLEIHYGLPAGTSFKIYGHGISKFQQNF